MSISVLTQRFTGFYEIISILYLELIQDYCNTPYVSKSLIPIAVLIQVMRQQGRPQVYES